jgi:small-conductance mechanosensitive channel
MKITDITDLDDGSARLTVELSYDEILLFARAGVRSALMSAAENLAYDEGLDELAEELADPQPYVFQSVQDKYFGVE